MAEVASGFVTLIPSFKGGGRAIQKELDGAAGPAGVSAGKRAGRGFSGGIVGGLGKMGAALGAAFAAPIVLGGLNSLVDRASDLNETVNKSQVIFGKQAGAIDKWASSAATNLGLSKSAALAAAAGFGDMFSQIGFTGKAAASMSTQVVQAAADLGSFSNLDTADVSDRIAAAFRGEYDSLQAVIPNINAARVESEAMAKTGKKSAKSLTAQEKAAAVLAIVQKDGARAMGDFARTSNGVANKSKILAARMEDAKARTGALLLPIKSLAIDGFMRLLDVTGKIGPALAPFVGGVKKIGSAFKYLFTDGVDGAQSFAEVIDNVFGNSGKFVAPLRTAGQFIKDIINGVRAMFLAFQDGDITSDGIVGGFERIGATVRAAIPVIKAFVTGTLIPLLSRAASFITTQVVPAVMGIVNAVRGYISVALPIVQAFVAGMIARIRPMLPTIVAIFSTVGQIVVAAMGLIQAVIQRVTAIIGGIWSRWGTNIMNFIATVFGAVLTIIGGALKVIQGVIKVVTSLIKGDWSGAWDGIKQIVAGAWQVIKGVVSGALTIIKGIIGGAGGLLKLAMSAVWGKVKEAVSAGVSGAVDLAKALPGKIVDALGNLGKLLYDAGAKLLQGLADGIKSRVKAVTDVVGGVAGAIKGFFPGSPVKTGPLTSWNNGGAGKRLGDMLAEGLHSSRRTVASASAALANSVAYPNGGAALAGAGSNSGSTFNVYANDPLEAAYAVERRQTMRARVP